jgi:hypothetical protein
MDNYFLSEIVKTLPIFVLMEKKILLSLFLFFGTIGFSFAQSNITSRHNSDSSWLNFLQNNMVSVTLAPEKAATSPMLQTTLNAAVPTTQMLFNALSSTPALQPDAIQTKTYRWGNTGYVITVFSAKRLETLYKRETINNKAK